MTTSDDNGRQCSEQVETVELPDVVARLYTPKVMAKLAAIVRQPAPKADHAAEPMRLRQRLFSAELLPFRALSARRLAWWSYLAHADRVGLLEDNDLCHRLTDTDDDNFRGALAECLTVWFFAKQLNLTLRRHNAIGRRADFEADGGIHIEVKAPYVPVPGNAIAGDDASVIRDSIREAGKQFRSGFTNIVVLVPILRTPVWMDRDQFVKATIGEWALSVPICLDSNVAPGEATPTFLQKGKLAQWFPTQDGGGKTDLTRVSAVVMIEEGTMLSEEGIALQHYVHVIHNPFAACPLSAPLFQSHPQLVVHGEAYMAWTDELPGGDLPPDM
jgi:hypothetical protein